MKLPSLSTAFLPTTLHRPQPYGIGTLPGALLLMPAPDAADLSVADAYVRRGGTIPLSWRHLAAVVDGRGIDVLAELRGDDSLISVYNRFVLTAEPEDYHRALAADEPLPTLARLVAYVCGIEDMPPELSALDGELLAQGLVISAAAQLERGDGAAAMRMLADAVAHAEPISPPLAATALAQHAAIARSLGQADVAVAQYRRAIQLAGDDAPDGLVADFWIALGEVLHDQSDGRRHLLLDATRCYQNALRRGLEIDREPLLYARAHHLLALAYLAMPLTQASDQLRQGMAVQSLRAALSVYTKEHFPEQWAQVQMHLANALVYLPSATPADHLAQAVEAYEELLEVRQKSLDPVGYARLLANQATALAHLGIFGPAVEKLSEAHKLFHWHGEPQLAAATLEQLDTITTRRAAASSGLVRRSGIAEPA